MDSDLIIQRDYLASMFPEVVNLNVLKRLANIRVQEWDIIHMSLRYHVAKTILSWYVATFGVINKENIVTLSNGFSLRGIDLEFIMIGLLLILRGVSFTFTSLASP